MISYNFACVFVSKDLRFAPSIQEGGGLNYTRESGQSISFVCTASSAPLPDITWLRNGYPVQPGLNNKFQISEQTFSEFYNPVAGTKQSTMVVSDLGLGDSGSYTCRAFNGFNVPAILRMPFLLTVNAGM